MVVKQSAYGGFHRGKTRRLVRFSHALKKET